MEATRHERQEGAVVVEFAVIFLLFMLLLWGLITYGVIFAVQQSLSHASAEAARAAINVETDADAIQRAEDVAADQLDWLDPDGVTIQTPTIGSCGYADPDVQCLVVEVQYDWGGHAIVPAILDFATPDTLTSRAVIER